MKDILDILRADHEVFAKGTSIGIAKFGPELKTLGKAQFLCDLITGALIDICAHIFYGENSKTIRGTNVSSILQSHSENLGT